MPSPIPNAHAVEYGASGDAGHEDVLDAGVVEPATVAVVVEVLVYQSKETANERGFVGGGQRFVVYQCVILVYFGRDVAGVVEVEVIVVVVEGRIGVVVDVVGAVGK